MVHSPLSEESHFFLGKLLNFQCYISSVFCSMILFFLSETLFVKTSLIAQTVKVKRLPTIQETCVQSLGWEDPLEKEMANPFQYSCLENPMDRGSW